MNKILRNFFVALMAMVMGNVYANDVTDVLTWDKLLEAGQGNSYKEFSGKTITSTAVYAGQASSGTDSYIQLRTNNNNAGIVSTASGGKLKSVTITFNSTTTNRKLQVYGKNEAYTAATDLYNEATQGTLLKEIATDDESKTLTVEGDYSFIGLRSANSALYVDKIEITWAVDGGSQDPTPSDPTPSGEDVSEYNAIVDGKLALEFAAVAGENGGVANNAADGKSIITITAGKATVTAVGGTTPANDTEIGGAAQQITPGDIIDAEKHIYKVASVEAWNEIKWEKKNQGDIDFWYINGTGNPYVDLNAKENKKDDEWQGNYQADYIYYEPDGSKGLPITGLYYKFTASTKGAFKVKVFANKGNRKTFVVNAKTMKAERLLASGYINGVNGADSKKKLLTVEQVDSVHHFGYIYEPYYKMVKANEETPGTYTDEQLAEKKAECDALDIERQYVIGNGNQNFWGWLTFDVEAGEEYWVFQHSSQIGFGGFEFHEGKTAEELISGIEATYVYTTNFSTYEDDTTGERVTWKGEKAVGNGKFATEEPQLDENNKPINVVPFGDFFRNDGSAKRTSYCLLPDDVLAHSAKTEALTIAVWVRAQENAASADYLWAPLFTAYGSAPAADGTNTFPMMACQYRGLLQVNCAGWSDYDDAQNVKGVNTLYHGETDWLADKKWHYYTAVFEGENAKVYFDGELKNEWMANAVNANGVTDNTQKGLFSNGADLKYVCLGGNQAWNWNDNDAPFDFARLLIKNSGMSAGEIKAQMAADFPTWEEYQQTETGIETVKVNKPSVNNATYNLAGQRVDANYKGIVVKNGVKFMQK